MRKTAIAQRWKTGATALGLVLSLTACEQIEALDLPFLQRDDAPEAQNGLALPTGETETRDVEAPEIFQKSEAGLWDGRPSLGGVWVAHPDVTDPERVIIRNEDNGRFVVGALFRRERENPGPAIQVSSDAAEELGMLAGTPANLDVVALKREEAPVAPPLATTEFDDPLADNAPTLAAPSDIAATPLDPIAGAAAAVATAEAQANLAADLPPVSVDMPSATPIAPIGAPLDARGPLETVAPVAAAATAAPLASGGSSLEKPFIQIGIFSVEANANENAAKLRNDGMAATVLAQESQGKAFWRVLVGPAPNAQDRTAILAKIQALGFSDAYFVTN